MLVLQISKVGDQERETGREKGRERREEESRPVHVRKKEKKGKPGSRADFEIKRVKRRRFE